MDRELFSKILSITVTNFIQISWAISKLQAHFQRTQIYQKNEHKSDLFDRQSQVCIHIKVNVKELESDRIFGFRSGQKLGPS